MPSCPPSSAATARGSASPRSEALPAWRSVPAELSLERVLVFKYRRKVARDHTIRLDGSVVAFDGERRLAALSAPGDPRQLRAHDDPRVDPSLVPGERGRALDPAPRPSLEADTLRQQARSATDRFTRQMS